MLTTKTHFIIVFNFLFLFFFCLAPYSTLHAQPEKPKDFRLVGNGDTGGCNGDTTGTTYYISNNGNDYADALTPASAWETVSKVNNSTFSPGDHICFKRGDTWNEQLVVPSSGNFSGGYITFGAYGTGDKPVFDGTNLSRFPQYQGIVHSSGKNYIIFENLKAQNVGIEHPNESSGINFVQGMHGVIQNCEAYNTEASGIRSKSSENVTVDSNVVEMACVDSQSESISLEDVDTFEVKNNEVHNNANPGVGTGGAGIDAKNGCHDGTIHHNEVYNLHEPNGIYVDAYSKHTYNIEIYNNYIHDTQGSGIQIGSEQGGSVENISVHHNIVHDALKGGICFHNGGGNSGPVRDIYVYNNTLYHNGKSGSTWLGNIRIWNPSIENLVIANNITSQNYNFQVGIHKTTGPRASAYSIDYNVIYRTQSSLGDYNAVDGANAIKSDPLFVSSNDFHLQSDSPAKNACDNSVWRGIPNIKDYDGTPITDGNGNIVAPSGTVSCGAYE